MTEQSEPEGWGYIPNASKYHYFVNGRSLCGRWMAFLSAAELDPDWDDSPNNCAACRRKVATHKANQARERKP